MRPILPILFWKEVMKPYFYDLYRAVSRVFNPSLLFVFRVKRILTPKFFSFSFSFTCRIYPLGFTYKKITRSSCKITSMIYTSNCILSKVVSEASVGPLPSSIYCPPMSSLIKVIFSFVSFFFCSSHAGINAGDGGDTGADPRA